MRSFFSRLFSRAMPEVCPACEGGSGTIFDAESGTLAICTACEGSGRAAAGEGIAVVPAQVIDFEASRLARSKAQRSGRNAA